MTLRGYLAPFALPRKVYEYRILFISREIQNCLKMNVKAFIYSSNPLDSFPMTSHVPTRHPVAFRSRAPAKSESVYSFNSGVFGTFYDFFGLVIIFSRNILRSADINCNIVRPGCLASFVLPRKVHLFISR